jgi:hypothetical protein
MSTEAEAARDPIPFGYTEKSLDKVLPTEKQGETVSSYAEYMQRRGYEPLCFDNSAQDCWVIFCSYIFIWSFLVGFYCLLLKAALRTDDESTALWMFAFIFAGAASLTGLAVYSSDMEKKQKNFDTEWEAEGATA